MPCWNAHNAEIWSGKNSPVLKELEMISFLMDKATEQTSADTVTQS